jgi:16S rRNA C1402 (ribose-2'-O) methylase RsmI
MWQAKLMKNGIGLREKQICSSKLSILREAISSIESKKNNIVIVIKKYKKENSVRKNKSLLLTAVKSNKKIRKNTKNNKTC